MFVIQTKRGRIGPVPEDQIPRLIERNEVSVTDLVWRPGMSAWVPIAAFPHLCPAPVIPEAPAVPQPPDIPEPRVAPETVVTVPPPAAPEPQHAPEPTLQQEDLVNPEPHIPEPPVVASPYAPPEPPISSQAPSCTAPQAPREPHLVTEYTVAHQRVMPSYPVVPKEANPENSEEPAAADDSRIIRISAGVILVCLVLIYFGHVSSTSNNAVVSQRTSDIQLIVRMGNQALADFKAKRNPDAKWESPEIAVETLRQGVTIDGTLYKIEIDDTRARAAVSGINVSGSGELKEGW